MAVGLGPGDMVTGDGAVGTGAVFHQHRLAQHRRQCLGQDAGHRIGAAAGRELQHQAHRLAGPGLGRGAERRQRGGQANGQQGPQLCGGSARRSGPGSGGGRGGQGGWVLSSGVLQVRVQGMAYLTSPAASAPCGMTSSRGLAGAALAAKLLWSARWSARRPPLKRCANHRPHNDPWPPTPTTASSPPASTACRGPFATLAVRSDEPAHADDARVPWGQVHAITMHLPPTAALQRLAAVGLARVRVPQSGDIDYAPTSPADDLAAIAPELTDLVGDIARALQRTPRAGR